MLPDLARHRFCRAARGRKRGLLRQVVHSSKFPLVLPRYEPEMETGARSIQRQEIDALDPRGNLDRRNEPMEARTELGTLDWRHLTEIEEMPPGLDNDRSRAGRLQRGVLDEEVLVVDDVAPWNGGRPGAPTPFSGHLASGKCCSPTGDNTEADRPPQDAHLTGSQKRRTFTRLFPAGKTGGIAAPAVQQESAKCSSTADTRPQPRAAG